VFDEIHTTIRDAQDYFDYVHYSFLGFGLFLVFILAFYAIGLLLGGCGSVDGGTKNLGGTCLCCGTSIFFFFSTILWLMATIFFLAGALSDHLVCTTLKDPANAELGFWIDNFINDTVNAAINTTITDGGDEDHQQANITFQGILDRCSDDQSLYEVFSLDIIYNITVLDNWQEDYNIDTAIAEIKAQVTKAIEDVIDNAGIPQGAIDKVNDMAVIFDSLLTNVLTEVSGLDVSTIIDEGSITDIQTQLANINNTETLQDELTAILGEFNDFKIEIENAQTYFETYETELHYGTPPMSIGETLTFAINKSLAAVVSLQDGGENRLLVDTEIDNTIDILLGTIDDFIGYVIEYVTTDFAKCGPIMGVYDLTTNIACDQLLAPFNGLWSGLGLYLILMIPVLILSCCLEPLFRRKRIPAYSKQQHIEMTGWHC
jgi:hypothetical protein